MQISQFLSLLWTLFGGFYKWGYPQMDGLCHGTFPVKNRWFLGVPHDLGNLPLASSWPHLRPQGHWHTLGIWPHWAFPPPQAASRAVELALALERCDQPGRLNHRWNHTRLRWVAHIIPELWNLMNHIAEMWMRSPDYYWTSTNWPKMNGSTTLQPGKNYDMRKSSSRTLQFPAKFEYG